MDFGFRQCEPNSADRILSSALRESTSIGPMAHGYLEQVAAPVSEHPGLKTGEEQCFINSCAARKDIDGDEGQEEELQGCGFQEASDEQHKLVKHACAARMDGEEWEHEERKGAEFQEAPQEQQQLELTQEHMANETCVRLVPTVPESQGPTEPAAVRSLSNNGHYPILPGTDQGSTDPRKSVNQSTEGDPEGLKDRERSISGGEATESISPCNAPKCFPSSNAEQPTTDQGQVLLDPNFCIPLSNITSKAGLLELILPTNVALQMTVNGQHARSGEEGRLGAPQRERLTLIAPESFKTAAGVLLLGSDFYKKGYWRMMRCKAYNFTWTLNSNPDNSALPILVLDLQPSAPAEKKKAAQAANLGDHRMGRGDECSLASKKAARLSLEPEDTRKRRNMAAVDTFSSLLAGPEATLGQPESQYDHSDPETPSPTRPKPALDAAATRKPSSNRTTKRVHHETAPAAAGPTARWQRASEQQEEAFEQGILLKLQNLLPGSSLSDVKSFYSHAILKRRSSDDATDKVATFIVSQLQPGLHYEHQQPQQRDENEQEQRQQEQHDEQEQQQQNLPLQRSTDPDVNHSYANLEEVLQSVLDTLNHMKLPNFAASFVTDVERLHACALALALGHVILENDAVRALLLQLTSDQSAHGRDDVAQLLPLLAGNIGVLSDSEVEVLVEEMQLETRVDIEAQLLVWAAGAVAEMTGTRFGISNVSGPQKVLNEEEFRFLETLAPKLRAQLQPTQMDNPMRVLLPAFRQVQQQQGQLVLAVAASLACARQLKVASEEKFEHVVMGHLMRIFAQAASGGDAGYDILVKAFELSLKGLRMKTPSPIGVHTNRPPPPVPDDVAYALHEPEVQAAITDVYKLRQQQHPSLTAEDNEFASSVKACLMDAGLALYELQISNLAHGIVSVLRLVHTGSTGLPLCVAVEAVEAGFCEEGASGALFLKLMQSVVGLKDLNWCQESRLPSAGRDV